MGSSASASFSSSAPSAATLHRSLWLGALGVLMFAMTLPMTRLAVGPADAPQLPPLFVTAGRAAGAGLLAAVYLLLTRAALPQQRHLRDLLVTALGSVVGFPLFLGLALRQVPSMHAAVVTGILPLATAAMAALMLRQRAPLGFWLCASAGCALVLAFAAWEGHGQLVLADGWLLLAVLSASVAYVSGARLSAGWQAEQVISWVLVLSLPVTLPVAALSWPQHAVSTAAWGGFAYVTVFSMWVGFFAWYRALAMGGTLRVSQVQLLQPFLALLLAVPVLGEALSPHTLGFALAVLAVVVVGKRMPAAARQAGAG
ncbi:DMT family transporter [Ideonella sp.]|uniref:DMT family transporter n=1 Tax=Ideonella sp. TaxID=1929293 RepID=UPI002D0CE40D|nr:DMT family transporter [Ramlibacter sp.]